MQVYLQPAYILHYRSYRDTSLLLDLFTPEFGKVSVVARGARSPRSRIRGLLQPFIPLLASWVGKTELMTLSNVEANGVAHYLSGQSLLNGLYLNELLSRVLHRQDAYPNLYHVYQQTLHGLKSTNNIQILLRLFEKQLLAELGYALQLSQEANTNHAIQPESYYFFEPEHGLKICYEQIQQIKANVFLGKSLLDLHGNDFTDNNSLRDAKRLMRLALMPLLGNKPLNTRKLFT